MNQKLLRQLTDRPKSAHKYDFGHVLIVGGSTGMVGAPLLAGKAALRVGAGLVTIASDALTTDKLDRRVEEIMTLSLQSFHKPQVALKDLLGFIAARKVKAIVIGPGLRDDAAELVRLLIKNVQLPVVLDAGGLAAFRSNIDLLRVAAVQNNAIVLTPHRGEYAALMALEPDMSSVNMQMHAKQFAQNAQITTILKGSHTLVAHANGAVWQNTTGNPGLATAGTGDVLAGIIAGLLAQGFTVSQATECGVELHGLAGDLVVRAKTQAGLIASDLIEALPKALKLLVKNDLKKTA